MSDERHLFLLSRPPQELPQQVAREPIVALDFSGYDFASNELRLAIPAQLRDFIFPVPVDFSGCTFPNDFAIQNVQFLAPADFAHCTFNGLFTINNVHSFLPSLPRCVFKGPVNIANLPMGTAVPLTMRDCCFTGPVSILQNHYGGIVLAGSKLDAAIEVRATVGQIADFSHIEIKGDATFGGEYVTPIDFTDATFHQTARFRGATLQAGGFFFGCKFLSDADFADATFRDSVVFDGSHFAASADFSATDSAPIMAIAFRDCRFDGVFAANNRQFAGATIFRGAQFEKPPEFHNARLHQDTNFDAEFGGFDEEGAEGCFRTLKLAMSEQQAHEAELMFFGFEMEARAAQEKRTIVRAAYWLYNAASHYGQSIRRPLCGLLATMIIGALLTWIVADWSTVVDCCKEYQLTWSRERFVAVANLALAQTFAFLPFFRDTVSSSTRILASCASEKECLTPVTLTLVSVLQGVVSLIFLFLIGVGLRNLFRLR